MWLNRRQSPRPGDEVRFHRDRLIEDYVAAGMSRKEAERRAFFELGGVSQIEEEVRDVRGRWLDDFARDLRYAWRTLGRHRGFSAVAILSLALGIGANAAIFTLVNAVMLRALPVREPDRLVQITRLSPSGRPGTVSYPLVELFRDNLRSISGAFAQGTAEPAIVIDGQEELVNADLVTGSYARVLGLEAAVGRLLGPDDDTAAPASAAAMISDRYWDRRFGRSPSAIGQTFILRDRVFTIVGVTPASWRGVRIERTPDIVLPLRLMMSDEVRTEPTNNWLNLLARLKPGATIEQADAEVQVLWRAFLQTQAARAPERDRAAVLRQRAGVLPAPDGVNAFRVVHTRSLVILMGIVGLVLMLACVNLSGLLLARAAARQREISIRLAIGAGRSRLVRQLLTESLLLAVIGGALGLVMARWLSAGLVALFASGRPLELSTTPDWRVLVFTAAVSLAACVVAGLVPALQAVRVTLNPALKTVRTPGHGRLGKALVAAQIAISMVLIVGATLFVGTLVRLYAVDRGFQSDGVLVLNVRSSQHYDDGRGHAVQGALVDELRALPGVRAASAAQVLPIDGNLWTRGIQVEGYVFRAEESDSVGFNVIAPDYFTTLGTPLLAGREFNERDNAAAPKAAIVNESFARHFFGGASAIGRHVTSLDVTYAIVGVVRDAKYQDLRLDIMKTMYIPWRQREGDQPTRYRYLVRVAAGDPMRLVPEVARLVRRADPSLRVREAFTYSTLIDRSVATERVMAALGGFFGLLALVIAALGMFGVLAFQVARRTNELGVRMALGASRAAMMGLVFRELAGLVVAGVSIGIGLSLMVTGLTRAFLFGTTPTDPRMFAVAAAILAAAALAAGWLPARRASRVDPLVALRHE
jgi:predicted permease